jgi:hypothetical protein
MKMAGRRENGTVESRSAKAKEEMVDRIMGPQSTEIG